MANVIITGGAGYIGSVLTTKLLHLGHTVGVIDSDTIRCIQLQDCNKDFVENGSLSVICRDLMKLAPFEVQGTSDTVVVHMAGRKSVPESMKNPLEYIDYNIGLTKKAARIADFLACPFIFSSSASVYDDGDGTETLFYEESDTTHLNNPYAASKLFCEQMIDSWVVSGSCKSPSVCSLRYFNPIGNPLVSYGVYEVPSRTSGSLMSNLAECTFGGGDLTFHIQGDCARDFIDVGSVADAHILLIDSMLNGESVDPVYNVGTGFSTKVTEVVDLWSQIAMEEDGIRLPVERSDPRPGTPRQVVAAVNRFNRRFGPLEEVELLETVRSSYLGLKKAYSK